MSRLISALAISAALILSGCNSSEPAAEPKAKAKTTASADKPVSAEGEQIGTPMAERVAIIGLLNKRNGQTRDFEVKPGESVRFGKVVIRVRACEKTAPWESYQDQGAFVQLIVRQRPAGTNDAERWAQVFSGWLFKENPAANIVQHPIYDVWVKECRMSFPGEETPVEDPKDGSASNRSSAPQSAPADNAPAPAPAAPADDEASGGEGEATVET
ncbi:DUF2155 domain-containing protein [Sphingorhabdus sp.]|jgi:hypothetical protein|uniref:DUF2155 domain-containing protein n=1 Tax=Sphingorhabdus sp. TaxID=1902408 RepID=UPI002D1FAAF7|nr:DUF2155 domain-containing protein [Sphingorhabdus sp.]